MEYLKKSFSVSTSCNVSQEEWDRIFGPSRRGPTKTLLSFSRIDEFEKCPRSYFYKYVEGRRPPETAPLVVGNIYHAVLAATILAVDPHEALVPTVQDILQKRAEDLVRLKIQPGQLQDEIIDRLAPFQRAWFGRPDRPGLVPRIVEHRFSDFDRGFTGVIDLVSEYTPVSSSGRLEGFIKEPCVIDYKVVSGSRQRTYRDTVYSAQLALYAMISGVRRAAFVELPRSLRRNIRVVTVDYSTTEFARWDWWLRQMHEAILGRGDRKESFQPCSRGNPLCCAMWCDFWDLCYGRKHETWTSSKTTTGSPTNQTGSRSQAKGTPALVSDYGLAAGGPVE